ncbi:MAG: cytochrome c [Pseudomonadales bacterium]
MRRNHVALIVLLAIAPASVMAEGKELYDSLCQTCHGSEGMGDGAGVPEHLLKPRPFTQSAFKFDTDADWQRGTDQDLANVIKNGTAVYGGSTLMPPWAQLSEDEIAELVGYVRELQTRPGRTF